MELKKMYFSATGVTKKVVDEISLGINYKKFNI